MKQMACHTKRVWPRETRRKIAEPQIKITAKYTTYTVHKVDRTYHIRIIYLILLDHCRCHLAVKSQMVEEVPLLFGTATRPLISMLLPGFYGGTDYQSYFTAYKGSHLQSLIRPRLCICSLVTVATQSQ